MTALRTSIVIPVFNQLHYTQACLAAIDAHTPAGDWEVIVIDNGSTDGSGAWLSGKHLNGGPLHVIHNPTNTGFGHACNQGMAKAQGDGLLLLNNDTQVPKGWLERLWRPMDGNPAIGLVGPMSNNVAGEQLITAVSYGEDMLAMDAFAQALAAQYAGRGKWVSSLSGFCLLLRRQVVETIGGFDRRYGLGYFEDNDYCLRARLADFHLWLAADAFVHHYGRRTATALPAAQSIRIEAQWQLFLDKWRLSHRPIAQGYTVNEVRSHGPAAETLLAPLDAAQGG